MSAKLKLLFSLLSIIFLTNKLSASSYSLNKTITPSSDSLEVLIACLEKDPIKIEQIKLAFANENRLNYLGFCDQHSLLIIRTNQTPTQIDEFIAAVSKQLGTNQITIKQIGFGDILNFCHLSTPVKERIIKKSK